MKANIELDKLIAEKIMNYKVEYQQGWQCIVAIGESRNGCFSPSIEIKHAWEIVNKLKQEKQYYFKLENGDLKDYECSFNEFNSNRTFNSEADTAELAICLAALETKNIHFLKK